jgi:DinB superfamily
MDRTEIEIKLSKDRAWLLDTYAGLSDTDLHAGVTPSENDASTSWSALDHLIHLAGIEHNFNAMIRRHIAGDGDPVGLLTDASGERRTREQIMASVHKMNEDYVRAHRSKSLSEVVALGQQARAETLALLGELSDAQLTEKVPGAPWAEGIVGGIIATNADHGRMHWAWVKAARAGG